MRVNIEEYGDYFKRSERRIKEMSFVRVGQVRSDQLVPCLS
jgi:hypothetical protein